MDIRFEDYRFYIKPNVTDMRKGSTSLAYIVQDEMKLKPFEKSIFVFCGRTRRILKAIVWDRNGWIEIIKRLECGSSFKWPKTEREAMQVSAEQIAGMLKGYDVWRELPEINPTLVG